MNTNHSTNVISLASARRRATGRRALVEHLRRQRENAGLFLSLAREAGIDTGESAHPPLIPCIVGNSIEALKGIGVADNNLLGAHTKAKSHNPTSAGDA